MTDDKTDLMRVEAFAAEVGISSATAYNYLNKGKIKYVKKRRGLGFVRLIPRSELVKFKEITE